MSKTKSLSLIKQKDKQFLSTQELKDLIARQPAYPNLRAGHPAPVNNCYADLWKTPEAIQAACEAYCEYLRQGRDRKYYVHDEKVIKHYMKKHAKEFDPAKVELALREGLAKLEAFIMRVGVGQVDKDVKGKVNTAVLIFLAKNKLGWKDRTEVSVVRENNY